MVDHDTIAAAFEPLGLEVNRADPERLGPHPLSEPVRRVLTEVGLPERFGDHVFLDDLADGCRTMHEVIGKPPSGDPVRDELIYLGAGRHDDGILLDGGTGEVFALRSGSTRRISTGLDHFVDFFYLMQSAMNEIEDRNLTDETELDRLEADLFGRMAASDTVAMSEAGDYWRDMFEYSY